MPFGLGPRACVGIGVAMLELQLLALEFVEALDITIVETSRLRLQKRQLRLLPPSIILRVKPNTIGNNAKNRMPRDFQIGLL